jgi:hypothetical protein
MELERHGWIVGGSSGPAFAKATARLVLSRAEAREGFVEPDGHVAGKRPQKAQKEANFQPRITAIHAQKSAISAQKISVNWT